MLRHINNRAHMLAAAVVPVLLVTSLVAAAASASTLPIGDTTSTVSLPGGVVETLGTGPLKPTAVNIAAVNVRALQPETTCNPTCGNNGPVPPVTLADTTTKSYGGINGPLEATESSNLTGGQAAFTYNTQFGNSTATFYWLGSKPSINWQSFAPGFTWTQTGIDVSVSVPAGAGFSGGNQDVVWSGGQGGSGEWYGSINYGQKVGFASVSAVTAKFDSTASIWLGGTAYGVSADASDTFGPAGW